MERPGSSHIVQALASLGIAFGLKGHSQTMHIMPCVIGFLIANSFNFLFGELMLEGRKPPYRYESDADR